MTIKISILIPVYNESDVLSTELPEFLNWMDIEFKKAYEVVLVENGSTDDTYFKALNLAKKYNGLKVSHQAVASFGASVLESISLAKGEVSILLNADWLDREFVVQAYKSIVNKDIVIGSKVLNPKTDHRPPVRRAASHLLTFVLKIFFGFSFSDSHGLKAFRTSKIKPLAKLCKMNEIVESELLLLAQMHKLRIIEIPVTITEQRSPRTSFVKRIFSMAGELVKLYIRQKEHKSAFTRR